MRSMRFVLMGLGWLAVAIGVIGIFVPVLPTTPFIILAAALFARSSPRFEQWLIDHPRFGKPLIDWRREGAISRPAKIASVSMMTASYGILWFAGSHSPYVRIIVALILVSCAAFVLSRPEPT
ncbi:YbaN family protein [Pseudomonas sp. R2.Fl]|nr:YbaN family protein [Pseudomonas sp. R2.Fl]